jgi:membrane carboxypeptidase/penicillin-binding protein
MSVLTADAREFARTRLGSILQLDVALLLRARGDSWWTVERVAEELRIGVDVARQALESLASRNLLDVRIANDLAYRYAPWHESAARLMTEIAANHYEAREIVARGAAASVATRFADAFRIRKNDG